MSAPNLQRVQALRSSQTVWTMLHRFRLAMVRPDRNRLKWQAEVDETCPDITDREAPISPMGPKNNTSNSLSALDCDHQRTTMLGSDMHAHLSTAGTCRSASRIKR